MEPVRLGTPHRANAETTCQMLRALRQVYPHRPLVLIWDNVPAATSKILHQP